MHFTLRTGSVLGLFVKQTHFLRRFPVKCYTVSADVEHAFQEIKSVVDNVGELSMVPLKLTACVFGESFSSSNLQYDEFHTTITTGEEMVPVLKLKTLFQRGFERIYRLTDRDRIHIDKDTISFISALQPLQSFLEDIEIHEHALKGKMEDIHVDILGESNESGIAALLTHHLLSPLYHGHQYTISKDYTDKQLFCPCWNTNCRKKVNYGRTYIGSPTLWYGTPDVLLLPSYLMVMVESLTQKKHKKRNKLLEEEMYDMSEDNEQRRELDSEQATIEMISQAITSSLYISNLRERNTDIKIAESSLIPSIIINPCSLRVYMYDYRNDVLLCSDGPSWQLWDESGYKFNKSTILYIWMILNHMICMPELYDVQLECLRKSSNFHNLCEANGLQPSKISRDIRFWKPFELHKKEKRERFLLEP